MNRYEELQAVIDDPAGILSDSEIDEYIHLHDQHIRGLQAAAAAEEKREAEAAIESKRVAALRGKDRIRHALRARKIDAA